MVSLVQYILESILSNELSKEFKIEQMSHNDAEKILNHNDGFKKLGVNDSSELPYWEDSQHYKMMYKNKCIGIFAIFDFINTEKTYIKYKNDKILQFYCKFIYEIFSRPIIRNTNISPSAFLEKSIYVTYLEMLPDNSKELDISPIATIKVFFEKLKEMCKKEHKIYICAHGKDKRVTSLYCKCGNFKMIKDFFNYDDLKFYKEHINNMTALNTGVFYKI